MPAWSWHTEEQEQGREVTAAGMLISCTLSRVFFPFRLFCLFMFSCCTACMFCKMLNVCSASMCLRLAPSVEHCHACGCIALQVLSTDNAFIRVRKGVYTLRCWASQLPPQVDQGAAGTSGGAKVNDSCCHTVCNHFALYSRPVCSIMLECTCVGAAASSPGVFMVVL